MLASVDRLIADAGMAIKTLRIDSSTMEEPHVKEFVNNPDLYLENNAVDLVLYSPSVESGLSIWYDGFDRVFGYFSSSEPRQIVQMLERYRQDVPRVIFCKKSSGSSHISNFNPEVIKSELEFKRSDTFRRVGATEFKGGSLNTVFNSAYARYRARANSAKISLLENLADELLSRGHSVEVESWVKDKDIVADLKVARDENDSDEAIEKASADGNRFSVEEAKEKLEAGELGKVDRNDCLKSLLVDRFPTLDLSDPEIMHYVIERRSANVKGIDLYLQFENPEWAKTKDLAQISSLSYGTDIMLNHRMRHSRMQADFLGIIRTPIDWLLSNTYTNLSPVVEQLSGLLIENKETVRQVFNLSMEAPRPRITDEEGKIVQQERTHIMNVNKILRLFKLSIQRGKKSSVDGQRIQEYSASKGELWMSVYESMSLKYKEQAAKKPAQPVMSTVFSIKTEYLKNVDIEGNRPLSEAEILQKEYETIEF
jgi:hypothetical protein